MWFTRGKYINASKTLGNPTDACPGYSKNIAPRHGQVATVAFVLVRKIVSTTADRMSAENIAVCSILPVQNETQFSGQLWLS